MIVQFLQYAYLFHHKLFLRTKKNKKIIFAGEVANPSELLLFAKKKPENLRAVENGNNGNKESYIMKIIEEGEEDAIFKINIEDLVNETLGIGNRSLSVLVETEMAQALEDFIVKRHINAISDQVHETLERMQKDILNDKDAMGKNGIADAAIRIKKKIEDSIKKGEKKEQKRGQPVVGEQDEFDHDESEEEKKSLSDEEAVALVDKKKIVKGNFLYFF